MVLAVSTTIGETIHETYMESVLRRPGSMRAEWKDSPALRISTEGDLPSRSSP